MALWMNSTTAASRIVPGVISPSMRDVNRRSIGRILLPPPFKMYSPISEMVLTLECAVSAQFFLHLRELRRNQFVEMLWIQNGLLPQTD